MNVVNNRVRALALTSETLSVRYRLLRSVFQPENFIWGPVAPEDLFYGPIFLWKGPREQYKGIHDVVDDQGFAMHYRAISNTVSHLQIFRCERINAAKQKDGLTSSFIFSVLEAKIFQYGFLEEHEVFENNRYCSSK